MAILRSLAALIAGVVFIVAASTATDLVLSSTVLPQMGSDHAPALDLALALAYRTVFGILGGWITATLAPSRAITHAVVLGLIGTVAAAAGVAVMWSVGQHWYPIALVVLALPQTWLGGRLAALTKRPAQAGT